MGKRRKRPMDVDPLIYELCWRCGIALSKGTSKRRACVDCGYILQTNQERQTYGLAKS